MSQHTRSSDFHVSRIRLLCGQWTLNSEPLSVSDRSGTARGK